jgi:hypothetical protein
VEIFLLFFCNLVVEFSERALPVVAHPADADAGITRALAVVFERSELQEVVYHILPVARRGVDELVHLALPDVRAVDKRLRVHPQQRRHALAHVRRALDWLAGTRQHAGRRPGVPVPNLHLALDVVGLAVVGKGEFDGHLLGSDGDHLIKRLVECLRAVEGEETRLQQRGLAAPVQPVDDRHAAAEFEVGVAVAPEIVKPNALESHE